MVLDLSRDERALLSVMRKAAHYYIRRRTATASRPAAGPRDVELFHHLQK